jgi:hypothetical protein
MKNLIKQGFFIALIASVFVGSGLVLADAAITSATINGSTDISVNAGSQLTATVTVNLTGQSTWKSTAYKAGTGDWSCIDTSDHSGDGTFSELFIMNAPSKKGANDLTFQAFGNNDCTDRLGPIVGSASLLSSTLDILSCGTADAPLLVSMLAILLAILALILFYIIRKNSDKKKKMSEETKV